jgi:hypothetical protein
VLELQAKVMLAVLVELAVVEMAHIHQGHQ